MDTRHSPNPDSVRVALCGRPGVYRAGLAAVLEETDGIDVVGQFDNADFCARRLHELAAGVVLADVDDFAIEPLAFRRPPHPVADPEGKIIAMSTSMDSALALNLLRIGAQAVLSKDLPIADLVSAIRIVEDGGVVLPPPVAGDLVKLLRGGRLPAFIPPADEVVLTPRQHEILALVGQGLTNAEIATELSLGLPTVKTHISGLLRALNLRDRTQLAVFVWTRQVNCAGFDASAPDADSAVAAG